MTTIKPPSPQSTPDRIAAVPFSTTLQSVDGVPIVPSTFNPPPTLKKSRVDFRAEEFQRVLGQHGKFVTWRKAMVCPCLNTSTGQTRLDCGICDTSGFFYVDPLNIQALVLGVDKDTSLEEKFGIWVRGEASITVLPEYRLGHHDSIEMRDSIMPFSELIRKNDRHGVRSKLPAGHDSARYRIVNVVRCMLEVDGAVLSLDEGTHFSVTDDGWIKWLPAGNKAVSDGAWLSLRYEFHPVYVVESHPHVLRDDVTQKKSTIPKVIALPVQAMMKLDYLIDANGKLATTGVL